MKLMGCCVAGVGGNGWAARVAAAQAEQVGRDARRAAVAVVLGLRPAWPLPLVDEVVDTAIWGRR